MKINKSVHYLLRQLALVSALLFSAFIARSVCAVELVGKPVPVNSAGAQEISTQAPAPSSAAAHAPDGIQRAAVPDDRDVPPPPVAPTPPLLDRGDVDNRIEQMLERIEHHEISHIDSGSHTNQLFSADVIIPLFAITFVFGCPFILLILFAVLHFRAKASRQKNINDNIERLLAAGRDIPIELLRGDEPLVPVKEDNLRQGINCLGIGIGALAFLTILLGIEIGSVAFILIGIGISRLIIWKLSDTKTESLSISKVQD
ncbi:MAG: hypothetical protein EOO68_24055 [Moraxellaceae bacterium]|nr:MAG: hypothetical protein EOO68_24055 [Moraxellaceae bacterium]